MFFDKVQIPSILVLLQSFYVEHDIRATHHNFLLFFQTHKHIAEYAEMKPENSVLFFPQNDSFSMNSNNVSNSVFAILNENYYVGSSKDNC